MYSCLRSIFHPIRRVAERSAAARFATALRDRGVQLEVVAPCAPGSERFDIDLHIPVHRVPIWRNNFITRTISFALQTRHIVKNYRGDLVYALRPVFASGHCPMVSHFHTTRTGEARGAMTAGHWFIALMQRGVHTGRSHPHQTLEHRDCTG